MKNKIFVSKKFFAVIFALTISFVSFANIFAADYDSEKNTSITIVVPNHPANQNEQPSLPAVYPVSVWETRDSGRREIIRVYELMPNEHPKQIPQESFSRDGFCFELAEITRREIPVYSTREHIETVEVNTQTNDLETIIRLLASTLEFASDDGYFGVLALDVSSIRIESQGTTNSNFTSTQQREFPHLSNSDTSLVPKTIIANSRTYNLADVQWRPQSTNAVDYRQVPNSFTAVATYTRTGTRTSTIGYTTTAEYRGSISSVAAGRTEFTAQFIGIPIVTPVINAEQPPPADESKAPETLALAPMLELAIVENVTVEQVHIGGIMIEVEREVALQYANEVEAVNYCADEESDTEAKNRTNEFPIGNILIGIFFVGGIILSYFFGKKGKAMLGILKKPICFLFVTSMMYGVLTLPAVYATTLPSYSFGARSETTSSASEHLAPLPLATQSEAAIPDAPSQTHSSTKIHFDPRVLSIDGTRDSPRHFQTESHSVHGASDRYNYGDFIGVLTVERLGKTVNVFAGATPNAMDSGAGHFSFTGLNHGNTGLVGHNRGRAGFFSFVRELREGDVLTLEAGGIVRSYAVSMVYVIDEDDFSPLLQFSDNRLTLVTCVENRRGQRRVAKALEIFP